MDSRINSRKENLSGQMEHQQSIQTGPMNNQMMRIMNRTAVKSPMESSGLTVHRKLEFGTIFSVMKISCTFVKRNLKKINLIILFIITNGSALNLSFFLKGSGFGRCQRRPVLNVRTMD